MMKHLKKKDNYILNFDDNNNYMIKNIKLDKDYIIINVKYNNIKKNYNIKYYKSYIEDGFYKYFDSGDKKIIKNVQKIIIFILVLLFIIFLKYINKINLYKHMMHQ